MEFHNPTSIFFLLLTLLSISHAFKFNVGGSKRWVPNPSESYNHWAEKNRFQINDTIVFKYKKGSDSVLEVKKEDYDNCKKANPIKKFEDGDTEFKFDRSGPFYFISGKDGHCKKGQKLIVVVISPRTPPSWWSPPQSWWSPPPSWWSPPPSWSSPPPKTSHSPSPQPNPPAWSPSSPPSISLSPAIKPPSPAPYPAVKPPSSPSPASSPTPAKGSPAPTPWSATPSPSEQVPAQAPSVWNSPAPSVWNSTAPAPAPSPKNSGFSMTPSTVLVYSLTIVVGAALLRY